MGILLLLWLLEPSLGLRRRRAIAGLLLELLTGRRLRLVLELVLLHLIILRDGHDHALRLGLIALGDGTGHVALGHFPVLLDEGAANTVVAGAAIPSAGAFDAVSLADLTALHHRLTVWGVKQKEMEVVGQLESKKG